MVDYVIPNRLVSKYEIEIFLGQLPDKHNASKFLLGIGKRMNGLLGKGFFCWGKIMPEWPVAASLVVACHCLPCRCYNPSQPKFVLAIRQLNRCCHPCHRHFDF
ncbi:unnamed protein product, partial [Cuscuta epithymum]